MTTDKTSIHPLTDDERDSLRAIEEKVSPVIRNLAVQFMEESLAAKFPLAVCGAATASLLLEVATRCMMVSTGAPAAVIVSEEVCEISFNLQKHLAEDVSDWVAEARRKRDEAEYVSPEDQKRNDAMERGDYLRDRAKDERN